MPLIEAPRVDSLEIDEHVASTNMSDIFSAHFHTGSLGLAVKIAKQKVPAKFAVQKEASITPTIGSGHVLPVLGSGSIRQPGSQWNGLPYIVSPFNEGSLRDRVARDADSARKIIRIIHGAALGLRAIHEQGYVHSDVHIGNVFTLEDRGLVGDLGLAVRSGTNLNAENGGMFKGRVFGKLGYMPTEQMRGLPMAASSDVFSLGVTATYALSGRLPWRINEAEQGRQRLADTYRAILEGNIHELPGYVPPEVSTVIDAALEPYSGDRPSMDEFVMQTIS